MSLIIPTAGKSEGYDPNECKLTVAIVSILALVCDIIITNSDPS